LSIIAYHEKAHPGCGIKDVLSAHYKTYGRNYFSRYDYEEVESKGAESMISKLRSFISGGELVGKTFKNYKVTHADDFQYVDPVDQSVSSKQVTAYIV
jgi:phosphoglucomutase